jgi:hypothetical protein
MIRYVQILTVATFVWFANKRAHGEVLHLFLIAMTDYVVAVSE